MSGREGVECGRWGRGSEWERGRWSVGGVGGEVSGREGGGVWEVRGEGKWVEERENKAK